MSDPKEQETQKRTARSRGSAAAESKGTEAAATRAPEAEAPAPPAPKSAATTPAGDSGSAPTAAQLGGAMSGAMSAFRERLQPGEQLALLGGALVLGVYLIFHLLLLKYSPSEMAILVSLLLLVVVWAESWGQQDLGGNYRVVVGLLGLSLATFAVLSFLAFIRVGGSFDALELVARLIYWAAGLLAGYGALLIWRAGR